MLKIESATTGQQRQLPKPFMLKLIFPCFSFSRDVFKTFIKLIFPGLPTYLLLSRTVRGGTQINNFMENKVHTKAHMEKYESPFVMRGIEKKRIAVMVYN